MFIAMNRFQVNKGSEAEFERIWRERDSHLAGVPGFKRFAMLKGPAGEDHSLYVSHSIWEDEASFRAWTTSDAFRAAHKGAGDHRHVYAGPPVLELFETVEGI